MIIKEATEEFYLEDYDKGTQQWEAFQVLALERASFETVEQLKDLVSKFVVCPIDWSEAHWLGERSVETRLAGTLLKKSRCSSL